MSSPLQKSLFSACCLITIVGGAVLQGQSPTDWKVLSIYQYGDGFGGFDFEMNSEEIQINADFTEFTGVTLDSTDLTLVNETFGAQVEQRDGMLRFFQGDETFIPSAFVNPTGDYMLANSGYQGDGRIESILAFRFDQQQPNPIDGNWIGLDFEVEVDSSNRLVNWGYTTYSVSVINANTLRVRTLASSFAEDTPGEQFDLPFIQNGSNVIIDPDDPAEFMLSAAGDLLFKVDFENHGTAREGEFSLFIKQVSPDSVVAADMVGTYALHTFEFGKGGNFFDDWYSFDNETGYIELFADSTGAYYLFQSSFYFDQDNSLGAVRFGWKVEEGAIVITEEDGSPMEDAPSFIIGASKQILKSIEIEDEPGQYEFLMTDLAVRIAGQVPEPVKAIPMLRQEVDPEWAMWYGERSRLYVGAWPWVHFEQLGWMRAIAGGDGSAIWLWDQQLEKYLFTNHIIFPWMLSETGEAYYFNLERSSPDDRAVLWVNQP